MCVSSVPKEWGQFKGGGREQTRIAFADSQPSLGALDMNHDPRNPAGPDSKFFSANALGSFERLLTPFLPRFGDQRLRHGSSQDHRVTESTSLEFRLETFNTFKHAQFRWLGIGRAVGQILKSQPGRVSQVALKLSFREAVKGQASAKAGRASDPPE